MREEYLTAKAFADRARVSMQTIYKQMSSGRLAPYVKDINGQKMLPATLLDKYYNGEQEIKLGSIIIEEDSTVEQSESTVNQPDSSTVEQLQLKVEQLESTVEQQEKTLSDSAQRIIDLQAEADAKDKQITDLTAEVADKGQTIELQARTLDHRIDKIEELRKQMTSINQLHSARVEDLKQQIVDLRTDIATKDQQIKDLNDRLAEALALSKQQHYISAAEKTKDLIEVQTDTKNSQDKPAVDPETIKPEPPQKPQKKRSFWSRLFQ